jgi:hypothetical protein
MQCNPRLPQSQLALLPAELAATKEPLAQGSIVMLKTTRIGMMSVPLAEDVNEIK